MNHLWYLCPHLVIFSLFDKNVSPEIKRKIVSALKNSAILCNDGSHCKKFEVKNLQQMKNLKNKNIDFFVNKTS